MERVTYYSCWSSTCGSPSIPAMVTFYPCWSSTCRSPSTSAGQPPARQRRQEDSNEEDRLFCHCTYVYCVSIFVLSMPPWSPILPFLPFLLFHYLERLLSDSFGIFLLLNLLFSFHDPQWGECWASFHLKASSTENCGNVKYLQFN